MGVSVKKQSEIRQKFGEWDAEKPASKVQKLLSRIQERVWVYINSKSPEVYDNIINTLNELKALMQVMNAHSIMELLNQIYGQDRSIWEAFIWEDTDTNSKQHHENHFAWRFMKQWIVPEDIMKRLNVLQDKHTQIILRMAYIYWLTNKILTRK